MSWQRGGTADWMSQIAFLVVSAVGVAVAPAVLTHSLDMRRAKQPIARVGA